MKKNNFSKIDDDKYKARSVNDKDINVLFYQEI